MEASTTTFESALQDADDDVQRFDAWMGLAAAGRASTDLEEALEFLALAEPIAIRHRLDDRLPELHYLRGNIYYGGLAR